MPAEESGRGRDNEPLGLLDAVEGAGEWNLHQTLAVVAAGPNAIGKGFSG